MEELLSPLVPKSGETTVFSTYDDWATAYDEKGD
jgi:hypothetical protein